MRTIVEKIPAGQEVEIATGWGCGYLRLVSATTGPIIITDVDTGLSFQLEIGDDAEIYPVKRIRIGSASGVDETIKLLIGGPGEKAGSSKVGGAISTLETLPMTLIPSQKYVGSEWVQLVAPSATRRLLMIIHPNNYATIDISTLRISFDALENQYSYVALFAGDVWREEVAPGAAVWGMYETFIKSVGIVEGYA